MNHKRTINELKYIILNIIKLCVRHFLLVLREKMTRENMPYRVDIAAAIRTKRMEKNEGTGNTEGEKG